ncbi:MAG: phenylacetate--CoA ligase family protein [Desulfobacula sp.]|nr:phenylacetate--CoA ligase family protein [Desulfobacula sp.]
MFFQNFIAKQMALPILLRFAKCAPWPWYNDLLSLDKADGDALRKRQWDSLKLIIEYAQAQVPYYKESFEDAGVDSNDLKSKDDLSKIPTIDKKQISANFPDRITSLESDRDTWQYFATSGTTDRLMVIKDAEATSRNLALAQYEEILQGTFAPGNRCVNIPPDACSLSCGVAIRPPKDFLSRVKQSIRALAERNGSGLSRSLAGKLLRKIVHRQEEMPSFGTGGTRMDSETLGWYVEKIGGWKPNILSGLPTYLQLIARHIEKTGEEPPEIGSILPQGALSTPSLRKELIKTFNVPVHEVYGGHEFGCVASTCEKLDKMHVLMSGCFVETVKNGKHVAPGELGEIVLTVFSNKAMPLIRYRPGDVGRLHSDICSCGRESQLLTVEGRIQDTMVTSKGIFSGQAIIEFYAGWSNVQFTQLVQRSDTRCDLLIVEDVQGNTDLKNIAELSTQFLGPEMQIRPRIVSTIKPEVSGKFRFVKSTSFNKFHKVS